MIISGENVSNSIDLLNNVISRIDELKSIENEKKDNFNILTILGKETDEVVMCRVLWAILDSNIDGKRLFLMSFIRNVLNIEIEPESIENCSVYREYCIPQNGRRIDLAIRASNYFIPIEAKIYAGDQKEQCYDYLKYASGYYENPKEAFLYYLTIDKHQPSLSSCGGDIELLKQIRYITWQDVLLWLNSQKKICESKTEVIGQFCKAIELLIDRRMRSFDMKIEELMDSSDGIKAAMEIEEALNRKKTGLLHSIYDEIITKTAKETDLYYDPKLNEPWDYKEAIDEYHTHKLSYSTYPAITYNLGRIDKRDNGDEFYFILRYEIEWSAYIGYAIMKRDKNGDIYTENNPSEELLIKSKNILIDSSEIKHKKDSWWLHWEYITSSNQKLTENEPNFRKYNEAYLLLYDKDKRTDFVNKAVEMLKKFYSNVKK